MTEAPVALVTGTSRGIGRAIAESFLARGFVVAGCSRSPGSFEAQGYEHHVVDVANESQVREMVRAIAREHGRIDVVVNNAGSRLAALSLLTGTDAAERVLRDNFVGTFLVSRETAKVMMRRRYGRIINMSSMAVPVLTSGTAVYSAAKAAVVQFTRVLALELALYGITCNVVSPSLVETDMTAQIDEKDIGSALDRLAIRRFATTDDVCNAVRFFAMGESGYVTGQVIHLGLAGE